MYRFILGIALLMTGFISRAQVNTGGGLANNFSTYYWQRASHLDTLPRHLAESIFIGDSITDGAEW